MQRLWRPNWLIACLIGLLALQVSLRSRSEAPVELSGVDPGTPAPSFSVAPLESGTTSDLLAFAGQGGCLLLTFFSTDCPVCSRMRYTWSPRLARWRDSAGARAVALWTTPESHDIKPFFQGYDFSTTTITRIVEPNPQDALDKYGAYATPMTFLIDQQGIVRQGVLGDTLPTLEIAREHCGAVDSAS